MNRAFLLLLFPLCLLAQKPKYTHADTLRGTYTPERAWWNVLHYDLHVRFNFADSSISGKNTMTYKVLTPQKVMQIDLMEPMQIDSIVAPKGHLDWKRDGNAFFVNMPLDQKSSEVRKLDIYFHGIPRKAKTPPWDGGMVWARDPQNNPWISVACQGMAAQVWFPNKDHQKDEPDSVTLHFTVPQSVMAISNGRFNGIRPGADVFTISWKVRNPINNYNIIPYVGKYINFKDTLNGKNGVLYLDFWVLYPNMARAKQHFAQVRPMLRCFEDWFGPYPFYEDGYKLVEAPYLGMEHQSAIAYGNDYNVGYKGRDLSQTGRGLDWDFIIVHESGHEWFGNNITASDVADNWIHESFTAYSENLYVEYLHGKEAGADYVIGTRAAVQNDKPIIADYGVNAGGSLDIYYKGANMLHTIRKIVKNDSLWKQMMRGLNRTFRHQTVTSKQIEDYMISFLKKDLQKIFDQYLRTVKIPALEYRIKAGKLHYRWTNCIKGFDMQVEIGGSKGSMKLLPKEKWQKVAFADTSVTIDRNYYVGAKKLE
jgi:aminopeptidase N